MLKVATAMDLIYYLDTMLERRTMAADLMRNRFPCSIHNSINRCNRIVLARTTSRNVWFHAETRCPATLLSALDTISFDTDKRCCRPLEAEICEVHDNK